MKDPKFLPPVAPGPKVLGCRDDALDYAALRYWYRARRRQRVRPLGFGRWLVTDA